MRGLRPFLITMSAVAMLLQFGCTQATRQQKTNSPRPHLACDTGSGDGVLPPQSEDNPAQMKVGFISGEGRPPRPVIYSVRNGMAIFQGDIVLGSAEEVENRSRNKSQFGPQSVAVSGPGLRWPDNTVKYKIDSQLPNQQRVSAAIDVWQQGTRVKFLPAGDSDTDFVYFTAGSGCSSAVGRQGGTQNITLAGGCEVSQTMHEVGHALGLLHEHDRADRDNFITLNTDNISTSWQSQFQKVDATTSTPLGAYDYCSIMHYPQVASRYQNGNLPVSSMPTSARFVLPARLTSRLNRTLTQSMPCTHPLRHIEEDLAVSASLDIPGRQARRATSS